MKDNKVINSNSNEVLFVASPRFGSLNQQLHILNDLYEKAHDRGVDTVINLGPMVEGEYYNYCSFNVRFIESLKGQANYVLEMYPLVDGITTYYMDSRENCKYYDRKKFKISDLLDNEREDLISIGNNTAIVEYNGVKMFLENCSGNAVRDIKYKLSTIYNKLKEDNIDFDLIVDATQRREFHDRYMDEYIMSLPVLHSTSRFESVSYIKNQLGGTFVRFDKNEDGSLNNIEFEPVLYGKEDIWEENTTHKAKVRQLIIK